MTSMLRLLTVAVVLLAVASPALAQTPASPNYGPGVGAGVGMGLSVVGIGIGLGLIGFSALAGIARQPEQENKIRASMLLLAVLVEGSGIIGLVLSLAVLFVA
jgi:ATP synthase F0 subunit c